MRVLVTGASGFVGSSLCPELLRAGHDVIAVSRHHLSELNTIVLSDVSQISAAHLAGVDAIVNLAGIAHSRGSDESEYMRVNRDAVLDLSLIADRAGVSVLIQLSSAKVYGDRPLERITDNSPARPVGPYAQSKAAADDSLLYLAGDSDMAVVSLRPPVMYGPHPKGNIGSSLRAIRRGVPLPYFVPEPRRSFLSVMSMVKAIEAVLNSDKRTGGVFPIADLEPINPSEFFRLLGGWQGRRVRMVPLMAPPASIRLPKKIASRIGPLVDDFEIDSSAFADAFQFTIRTTGEGFEDLRRLPKFGA